MSEIPTSGRIKCDWPLSSCNSYFKRRYDMARHKREYHHGARQCPHPDCHYSTKWLIWMTRHIDEAHTVTLNVPKDFVSGQAATSAQQIQDWDKDANLPSPHIALVNTESIDSGTPSNIVRPENNSHQQAVTVRPLFSDSVVSSDANDFKAIRSLPYGMADEHFETPLDATAMATYCTLEQSNYLPIEDDQQLYFNTEGTKPIEQTLSSFWDGAEEFLPYANNSIQNECTQFDRTPTATLHVYSNTSTSRYPTSYGYYPIHAVSTSMDADFYNGDALFMSQDTDSVPDNSNIYNSSANHSTEQKSGGPCA